MNEPRKKWEKPDTKERLGSQVPRPQEIQTRCCNPSASANTPREADKAAPREVLENIGHARLLLQVQAGELGGSNHNFSVNLEQVGRSRLVRLENPGPLLSSQNEGNNTANHEGVRLTWTVRKKLAAQHPGLQLSRGR